MKKLSISSLLLFVIVVLLVTACTTTNGPLFIQESISSDSNPNLYIYRPSSLLKYGSKLEFLIDENIVVTLTGGTYTKLPIKPGKHEIISGGFASVEQSPLKICFETKIGENTYIKYEMQTKHGFLMALLDRPKFNNLLIEVEEDQALTELKETRLTTLPQRKY